MSGAGPAAVVVLDGRGAGNDLVGGKAAAVDRLAGWGLPVPPTVVVTARAYRATVAGAGFAELFARLRRGGDVPAAQVDAVFLRAGLPAAVRSELAATAARVFGGGRVAVRSSATVEDTASSSFAGQYHSVLDVDPSRPGQLEEAVLRVFASLHHPSPRAYRAALGIADEGAAMAAMVMPMVRAVRAGVLFTKDPTSVSGAVRVETVRGLADGLVSGRATPQVLLVPAGAPTPAGAAPEVAPLLAAAADIEARAGAPQDIEWAWDGARLWIVQARPVTSGAGVRDLWDDGPGVLEGRELTTAGVAEMLPGVLPPLRWEVASFVVEEGLRTMLHRLGVLPAGCVAGSDRLLRRVRGRAALDAELVRAATAPRGGGAVWRRWRGAVARRRAVFDADVAVAAAAELAEVDPGCAGLGDRQLLGYVAARVDLAVRAAAAEAAVAADAGAVVAGLAALVGRYLPLGGADAVAAALATPPPAPPSAPGASAAVFGGPTWEELGGRPPARPPDLGASEAAERAVAAAPGWPGPGLARWVRGRQVGRLADAAARQLARRELAKQALLLLGGQVRAAHLEAGGRLAARGLLAAAGEVELLSRREVRAALLESAAPPPAELARRRRWVRRHEEDGPLPGLFRGVPAPGPAPAPAAAGRLEGWPVSGGRFRGRARRVVDPGRPGRPGRGGGGGDHRPVVGAAAVRVRGDGGRAGRAPVARRDPRAGVRGPRRVQRPRRGGPRRPRGPRRRGRRGGHCSRRQGVSPVRARGVADIAGADRLRVFVPAVMGVGLLFWLAGELRDLVRAGGRASEAKRAAVAGHAVARQVAGPGGAADTAARAGLRPRPVYLVAGVVLAGGGVYVGVGAAANFARRGGYVEGISWVLVLALSAAAAALAYGAAALAVYARYPVPPAGLARVLRDSPLTVPPAVAAAPGARPPWQLGAAVAASAAAAALLSLVVAEARHVVGAVDEGVAAWFHGLSVPLWSQVSDAVLRTPTVVVMVVVVGVASARCRALALAYAAAAGLGLAASAGLRAVVQRPRPGDGPLAGWVDSYPSGHVLQAVVIAGLVPLAVAVLTGRTRLVGPLTAALGAVAALSAASRVADGLHWPTDVAGGALIGLALALGARWVVADGRAHRACRGCPWSPTPTAPREHRGLVPLGVRPAAAVRVVAHLSAAAVALALAVLTLTVGVPSNPEGYVFGSAVERPVQLALAGVVSLGALLAWRWEAAGAVLIAFAATCLGVFAAVEYRPVWALALTGAALVPAVLLWLSWQHRRTAWEMVVLATVTALLLGTTWAGASRVYNAYFGPTHPDSAAAALDVDRVQWAWAGALGPDTVTVTARLAGGGRAASLRVAPADGSGAPTVEGGPVPADGDGLVRLRADGLRPATSYTWTVVVDGVADTARGVGRLATPGQGPFSFRVTAGSCARVGSNGAVFDALAAEGALVHLALGDLHYGNIEATGPGPFLDAYQRVLTQPGQAAFYRGTPVAYVWDDHDYGPNDAGADSPGRDASRSVFDRVVPHYPFASPGGTVNQAFTLGRVRFVMTDSRSAATADTLLGQEQLRWLIGELTAASRTHALVVWANPVPWIGAGQAGADGWPGHPGERRQIADALAGAGVRNLVMVSGDAHMVALDDGTNSGYSTSGAPGFPVLHAAALDRPGGFKGGPYSDGAFPGGGQYGVIDIADDGEAVTVTLSGRTWDGRTLVSRTFAVPTGGGG